MAVCKKTYYTLYFLMLLPFILCSQSEVIQFKVYGFEEGLSHRNAFKIQQDPLGFIWIATIDGLNKFDGNRFVHYNNSNSDNFIPNNYISDMLIGEDSILWLADLKHLVQLDIRTNKVKEIQTDSSSAVYSRAKTLSNLYLDASNNLWTTAYIKRDVKAYLQRLKVDGPQKKIADFVVCKGNYANVPIVQVDTFFYVGMFENELWKLDSDGDLIQKYTFDYPLPDQSFSRVIHLQKTKNNILWVLLDNGQVYFLNDKSDTFQKHPITQDIFNKGVSASFLVEDNGDVWVGGIGTLWHYSATKKEVHNYNASIKQIIKNTCKYRHIFKDDAGVIWIATDFGVVKIAKTEKLFTTYLNGGSEYCNDGVCSMRGITGDDKGNVYFSYYNSIHVLDTKTDSLYPLFQKNNFFNSPFGLLYHENALWTGNGKRIDLKTLEIENILDRPAGDYGIPMLDYEGVLWFGYRQLMFQYNTNTKALLPYNDPTGLLDTTKLDIHHMYQGKTNNYIWISTIADGLYKIDKNKGVIDHYTTAKNSKLSLLHNKVNVTYEDRNGFLWIGTGKGLHRLDIANNKIKAYTVKDGLPNVFINGLLSEGDSCIWVSTDNGLSRFQIATEEFTNFYQKNGLSKNEFNRISFYKDPDGRMYFGGLNGVNAFYPSSRYVNPKESYEAKLLFTAFSKYDGSFDSLITKTSGLSEEETIEISHRDKFFTFNFALANYKSPRENQYAYLLDGFEEKWSEPSAENTARYNNIPPGNYIFRVKASSKKGTWNEKQLAIKLNIEEAFYKTKWFFALCALAIIGLFYLAFRYRIYTIQERRNYLEKQVKLRTIELEREKKKSDDLLLNILPAEAADELKAYGKTKAKRYESVTVFFSDFKDFSRITENLSPEALVSEIDFYFKYYDKVIEKYGLEKIKTIGDAYMCAGGLPVVDALNAQKVVMAALEIQTFMDETKKERMSKNLPFFEARIGLHSGSVIAGIVGIKKFAYDIWGDTVNIASRMESNGAIGKVNISDTTFQLVKDEFVCNHRGKITAKNKGEFDMYFVERIK